MTEHAPPLAVDLDGTLIRSDALHESTLKLARETPHLLLLLPLWLAKGKAFLKREIAQRVELDVALLPYNAPLMAWLREQKAAGRRIVLCTAADVRFAQDIAAHLDLFDEVMASDGNRNLSGDNKAQALVERFGEQGFDYAGNSRSDVPVWAHARRALVVDAPAALLREVENRFQVDRVFARPAVGPMLWLRAMRLHQWLKNLLVLMPVVAAFQFDRPEVVLAALLAFLAFGLCASSVYVLNDLLDLESDRAHDRKRNRPFAAGALSIPAGLAFAALLLATAAGLASLLRPAFGGWLLGYFAVTLAYSVHLKRRVIIDCLVLGILYTLRIVAGCAAAGVVASFWLLAFSLFLFNSLAFVKTLSELSELVSKGVESTQGRGYLASDLSVVQVMGIASGFGAVMLLALYIDSTAVARLYAEPERLWLAIPVMFYWVSRMWMQAERGNMHDDPVVFAVRDPYSLACAVLFGATLWFAR